MSDYTKEPWELQSPLNLRDMDDLSIVEAALSGDRERQSPIIFARRGAFKLAIAKVYNVDVDGSSGATEANAKLLRAAPEMAQLLTVLRDEWFEPHYGVNDVGMGKLLLDKIRTILKPLEGR